MEPEGFHKGSDCTSFTGPLVLLDLLAISHFLSALLRKAPQVIYVLQAEHHAFGSCYSLQAPRVQKLMHNFVPFPAGLLSGWVESLRPCSCNQWCDVQRLLTNRSSMKFPHGMPDFALIVWIHIKGVIERSSTWDDHWANPKKNNFATWENYPWSFG